MRARGERTEQAVGPGAILVPAGPGAGLDGENGRVFSGRSRAGGRSARRGDGRCTRQDSLDLGFWERHGMTLPDDLSGGVDENGERN